MTNPIRLAAFGIAFLTIESIVCTQLRASDPSVYSYTQAQMGVPFTITLYAPSESIAFEAVKKAYQRVETLNGVLSHYEYESEISRLSRSAGSNTPMILSDTLWTVLTRAQSLSRETDGAFDITVGLCARLWSKARREKSFPTIHHLEMVRSTIGYDAIRLDETNQSALLTKERMLLDLGGIAKGFALDEAWKTLREMNINAALIQAGGDLLACGSPPGKLGWPAGLVTSAPDSSSEAVAHVLLTDKALASSGDLYQYVEIDGKRYSHILDPKTGLGLTTRSLVHVIANDAITADSLATALSVMDPKRGLVLVESKKNVEARIYLSTDNGVQMVETGGFASFLTDPNQSHP